MNTCYNSISALMLVLLASCSNTAFIGHRDAYDINAELKPDLSAPVSMNVGFESHSAVAVPPQQSLLGGQLWQTDQIAKGDVLPTITRLSIERIAGNTGTEFDYVTVTASGDAAIKTTATQKMASSVESDRSSPAVEAVTDIATDPKSIR